MTNPTTSLNLPKRRRNRTAQSLTVAIIVLFLLLFLGGLFIAMIVNSLKSTKTAAEGTASDKLAEAGIKYLDDQLTQSPEGADWRPVPYVADPDDNDGNGNYNDLDSDADGLRNAEPLRTSDPDYDWLQPCKATGNEEPCGYSRAEFGGRTPSAGNLGGRALVKIVYNPDSSSAISRSLQLFSVGRTGIIDASDPTTFANSEGKGARRELIAYKQLGLVEFVRNITNKDDRSVVAALGASNRVLDTPFDTAGRPQASPANVPQARSIESVYHGPIHSNAALTFFGINRLLMNSGRGDALTVSSTLNIPGGDSQVFLTSTGPIVNANAPVLPSNSPTFSSFQGLVRDHAPQTADNLRRVAKTTVPLMDLAIGENGLTRYKALTRESEPMEPNFVVANPLSIPADLGREGRAGWGSGLYLDNREDVQNASERLLGAYSPRANWTGADTTYWKGDNRYVPPAVVITLTPRHMTIQRSVTSVNRSFLRDNTGRRINQTTVVRYSGFGDGSTDAPPVAGLTNTVRKLEGYPAKRTTANPNVWEGDYVVYAEGNIRIRGTAGGLDPETLRYYIRHLTFVSGGNIYIDGNLLKDNIPDGTVPSDAELARGRSSIALLAKNYVVLNTTQFLNPGDNQATSEDGSEAGARAIVLGSGSPNFTMRLAQGPAQTYDPNTGMPAGRLSPLDFYGTNLADAPHLFLRHSAAGVNGATAVRLGVNNDFFRFPVDMAWPNSSPANTTLAMGGPTSAESGVYFDHVFSLHEAAPSLNNALLYPFTTQPYQATNFPVQNLFGIDNFMAVSLDVSAGIPNPTDYRLSRFGVAPLDIRVEALIYAQEGSFFIIPGPWLNPDPNDTYEKYIEIDPATGQQRNRRAGDNLTATPGGRGRIDPSFPFYGEPQDIRITIFGAITENLPAEVGDQAAWLEKWGWVPHYYGSTGLPVAQGYDNRAENTPRQTVHSANGLLPGPKPTIAGELPADRQKRGGSGIVYLYDDSLVSPIKGTALRQDSFGNTLPVAPRLPVAPGLLYAGEPGA